MADRRPGPRPEQEGRALVERLGGTWTGNGGLCRCPAHEDRTPSQSVRAGPTRLLLHCFAGCSAQEILRVLEASRLLEDFIDEARQRGLRCVRVVHGKGMGILKARVRRDLSLRDDVMAYAEPADALGGSGAVLVLLNG